jgi:hypothetical protein
MVIMFTRSIAKRILILFSCWLAMSGAQANWGTSVTANDTSINLGPDIQWVKDDTNSLTFEQVQRLPQGAFNKSSQNIFNRGFTSSGYWLRFRLNVPSELINSPWLLEIPFPILDYVALYSPDKNMAYSVFVTGDRSPFSQRDLNTTDFVFKLKP